MVGVREAVRVGARRREHRLLLEREHEVDRAGRDEHVGDRLGSLRVGDRVRAALVDAELAAEPRGDGGEEARAVDLGRPDLEVRVSRAAERAGAEQRAAEVGGRAAAPGDDAARRTVERPVGAVEDAGTVQRRVGVLRALDVELVAGRAVEGPALVGADLGLTSQRAQQRERAARDGRAREVEVDVDAAAPAEVRAAGDVEEPGQLGEPVALGLRRDRRELLPQVVGQRA